MKNVSSCPIYYRDLKENRQTEMRQFFEEEQNNAMLEAIKNDFDIIVGYYVLEGTEVIVK